MRSTGWPGLVLVTLALSGAAFAGATSRDTQRLLDDLDNVTNELRHYADGPGANATRAPGAPPSSALADGPELPQSADRNERAVSWALPRRSAHRHDPDRYEACDSDASDDADGPCEDPPLYVLDSEQRELLDLLRRTRHHNKREELKSALAELEITRWRVVQRSGLAPNGESASGPLR